MKILLTSVDIPVITTWLHHQLFQLKWYICIESNATHWHTHTRFVKGRVSLSHTECTVGQTHWLGVVGGRLWSSWSWRHRAPLAISCPPTKTWVQIHFSVDVRFLEPYDRHVHQHRDLRVHVWGDSRWFTWGEKLQRRLLAPGFVLTFTIPPTF